MAERRPLLIPAPDPSGPRSFPPPPLTSRRFPAGAQVKEARPEPGAALPPARASGWKEEGRKAETTFGTSFPARVAQSGGTGRPPPSRPPSLPAGGAGQSELGRPDRTSPPAGAAAASQGEGLGLQPRGRRGSRPQPGLTVAGPAGVFYPSGAQTAPSPVAPARKMATGGRTGFTADSEVSLSPKCSLENA